jgi:hypothetical protein
VQDYARTKRRLAVLEGPSGPKRVHVALRGGAGPMDQSDDDSDTLGLNVSGGGCSPLRGARLPLQQVPQLQLQAQPSIPVHAQQQQQAVPQPQHRASISRSRAAVPVVFRARAESF